MAQRRRHPAWAPLDRYLDVPVAEDGTHRVVFADDVAGTRVALVLGRQGARTVFAWFTGPSGADPAGMALAAAPGEVPADDLVAFVDTADRTSGTGLLVAVGRPGDRLSYSHGVDIDDSAEGVRTWTDLPGTDGVVATTAPLPGGWPAEAQLRALRGGATAGPERPVLSDRILSADTRSVPPTDPRGLAGAADPALVADAIHSILGQYGLPFDQVHPVLLAAARYDDAGHTEAVLVGTTLPSGATVAWLALRSANGSFGELTPTVAAPAGTPLLERVFAVPVYGRVLISGPASATSAEMLDANGAALGAVSLVQGAGGGPLPAGAAGVRLLDAAGHPVASGPLTEIAP